MGYKRLIEHRLPLAEVSAESAREKSIRHGHISTLHIWWARRPLAASRAAVFATLVPDTDENYELVKKIVPWEAVKDGNNEHILEARRRVLEANGGVPPKVLDPFAGGGAIPLEALRLGCEVYSLDLNPVAHIIQKATLEFPQKYGQPNSRPVPEYIRERDRQASAAAHATASKAGKGKAARQEGLGLGAGEGEWERAYKQNPLATDVRYWGEWVLEKARAELAEFYPDDIELIDEKIMRGGGRATASDSPQEYRRRTPVAYLWARTVTCTNPACRAEVPMVRQWWLAKKPGKSLALKPLVNPETKRVDFAVVEVGKGETWPDSGTATDGTVVCIVCQTSIPKSGVQNEANKVGFGHRLLTVVFQQEKQGRQYYLPTQKDYSAIAAAEVSLLRASKEDIFSIPNESIPEEKIWRNSAIRVLGYGFSKWTDFFTPRQLKALEAFSRLINTVDKVSEDGDYSDAIKLNLSMAFDRLANSNANLCRWHNSGEKIEGVFSRQSITMIWDYAEANPIGESTGDWQSALNWIVKSIENTSRSSRKQANLLRGSASKIPIEDNVLDAIVTDPPYYDAVPYSGLSDYFYVWLKRNLPESFRRHFRTPLSPKSNEIVQNPSRHTGGASEARAYYESMMGEAFREMNRVLKPSGEATIVFAHKSTEAWETLIDALVKAGFMVEASWPLRTEMVARNVARDAAALASSTFLNCTKRTFGGVGYFNEVRQAMVSAIRPQLAEFWASGIRGADFFMSAIGPGLESYSKHDEVRRVSGEVVTVGEFLDEVRKIVMEFALEQVLGARSLGGVDAKTQFGLLALWGYGPDLPSDEARKLAQSVGEELGDLAGLVKVSGEKAKLLPLKERAKDKGLGLPKHGAGVAMIDAMHKAVALLGAGSRQAVSDYLAGLDYFSSEAFWQTMQALAEVQDGAEDGRALHELLTIRDNLPRPSADAQQMLLGANA